MTIENRLWSQRRIQAELAEAWISGFQPERATNPSSRAIFPLEVIPEAARLTDLGVRLLLCPNDHVQKLYVFFVIDHASRQVLHVHVTPNPTASWAAQQMVECRAWDRKLPRFLVHDRDGCYGATFHRRVRNIGIAQVRTPFRSPRANAIPNAG
jgi:putative transposase